MNVSTNRLLLNLRWTVAHSVWTLPHEEENDMEVSYAAGTATTLRFAHSEIDVGGVDGLGASETDVSSILEDAQSASEASVDSPRHSDSGGDAERRDTVPGALDLHLKVEDMSGARMARVRRLTGTDELERGQRSSRIRRR